jgi:hypothetical protein
VIKRPQRDSAAAAKLNDISNPWPFHFKIAYTEDEQRIFRKAIAARHAWGGGTVWALAIGAPLAIGLVALGAFALGFVTVVTLPSVLCTAYVAFAAGITSYYFFLRGYFRKFYREDAHATWNFSFDDSGVAYNSEQMEVRLAWRTLDCVEDRGSLVLLLFKGRGIGIPPRIFSNDTARAAFALEVAARIKAATETAKA